MPFYPSTRVFTCGEEGVLPMQKQIVVDIDESGETRIETRGFKGAVCLEESKFLKDLLGKELSQYLTPMFYQKDKVEIRKHINLCG